MVAGAREQFAGVRDKAIAEAAMRELEMQVGSRGLGAPHVPAL